MAEEPSVTYAVKEVLDRIDNKLDSLAHKLDSKAEEAEVRALQNEVRTLHGRVEALVTWRQQHLNETQAIDKKVEELKTKDIGDAAVGRHKKWIIGLVTSQAAEGAFILLARHWKW